MAKKTATKGKGKVKKVMHEFKEGTLEVEQRQEGH